ncbi:hypothetical protein TIMSHEL_39 [Mycobacterium phage Timshel]|uniref:Uncharacterized protein n=1 Tax=Mycobacterium phage Timshel TaxID=1032895 RepID=G1DB57_9CAUD|nr:hypothetical protein FDI10_gp55 [Mycobacterium phage Timshel]AEJ92394.1 hypothetical protein TIMSHEL_39 [Mycobacterium phage Timshel]
MSHVLSKVSEISVVVFGETRDVVRARHIREALADVPDDATLSAASINPKQVTLVFKRQEAE